jgi:hypothetical protein
MNAVVCMNAADYLGAAYNDEILVLKKVMIYGRHKKTA